MPINYKNYCADWKLRSKFIRFFRAKNKCEVCNVPNHKNILRGCCDGIPAYQFEDGAIFREDNSEFICFDYVGIVAVGSDKPFIKIVLTTAHLDHDIKNNSFFNLKAMCQKCHNNYDKYFRKENRRKNTNQTSINFNEL